MSNCLFCDIVSGAVPADVVAETERTVAFRDVNPQAPVHVLVIPRVHIDNAAAIEAGHADDLVELVTTARRVAEQEGIATQERGYRLVCNVGVDARNSVPHLHLHVLGGRTMGWPPG